MRKKTTLNLGIAALALSASLFLGCQDFLSEDKSVQSAKTSSETPAVTPAETAKDMPAQAVDTSKPAAAAPAPSTPVAPDITVECKEIHAQMQTAMQSKQDLLYMELKNKFGSLNCEITNFSTPVVPPTPPDSATVCKNLRATLATLDPASPKYLSYQQEIAARCAETQTPAAPVVAPTAPVAPDNAAECKEIHAQMQSAKEPLYGELKDKFVGLKCHITNFSTPYVPPDSATLCKNLKATLAMLDPTSPKYPSYQQDIATYCADANTPAAPIAPSSATTAPVAPDNAAECKEIYAQMQTAKDPLYGELKNKFGSLNCDLTKAAGPYVPPTPPDSATVCKNFQTSLDQMDPSSSKYPLYLEQIAIWCTAKP